MPFGCCLLPIKRLGKQRRVEVKNKVNGRSLEDSTRQKAIETFCTSTEPIVIEMQRRIDTCGNTADVPSKISDLSSAATQTENDNDADCCFCSGPEQNEDFLYHMNKCKMCSSMSELGLTDLENQNFVVHNENGSFDSDFENEDLVNGDLDFFYDHGVLDQYCTCEDGIDSTHLRLPYARSGSGRHNSTDTNMTELSSNQDDSGIGRTDESVKTDESSEQEMMENYTLPPNLIYYPSSRNVHFSESNDEFLVETNSVFVENKQLNANQLDKPASQDVGFLCQQFHSFQIQPQETSREISVDSSPRDATGMTRRTRMVPRMGTKLDHIRSASGFLQRNFHRCSNPRESMPCIQDEGPVWLKQADINEMMFRSDLKVSEESSIQKVVTSFPAKDPFCKFKLEAPIQKVDAIFCDVQSKPMPTKKLPVCDNGPKNIEGQSTKNQNETVECHNRSSKETLQKLYAQHIDVMYTNSANLDHTIKLQQKLFSQQLQNSENSFQLPKVSAGQDVKVEMDNDVRPVAQDEAVDVKHPGLQNVQMEWVMKRRSDGSRYITRRPVRKQMMKQRAQRLSEERRGLTSDDDAASELKVGRYWSKEERKGHLRAKRDKKLVQQRKMETVRETDDQPDIVVLSRRKTMQLKCRKLFDGFTTVEELLAHGNSEVLGKTFNPLLSVTTV